jgi:hypothetical protein
MTHINPILFVAGLGRCGTTMVMQMLWRGGFPVAGPPPAFETDHLSPRRVDLDWLRQQEGAAVKWIAPPKAPISRNDLPREPVVIVMQRDTQQQARSQIKLLRTFGTHVADDRRTRRAWQSQIEADTVKMMRRLGHVGTCYHLSFEFVLSDPTAAASKLRAICLREFGHGLDVAAAASVVRNRSPECAPDLSVEMGYNA